MIQLNQIELQGFKSIRELSLNLKPLNVLIGANGSGKSNFLSFFKMLNHITTDGLETYVNKSGGGNALLHYGAKMTPHMLQFQRLDWEVGKSIIAFGYEVI